MKEDEAIRNEDIAIPDYMVGQTDHTKHLWMQWKAISEKIDSHPERFYTVSNQTTGNTKILDCKASVGCAQKTARQFGAGKDELEELRRICFDLQQLKSKKAGLNKQWSKEVFGKNKGEKTVLDLRYTELIELFSKFYTSDEILKIVKEKWGMAIKFNVVKRFYYDNKEKIDKGRLEYTLNSKETRFATDAGRMETLSMLAWEMEQKFEKGKSIEVSKELRSIIEQIRKEVKGDEIKLTIDGKIDINATIQANLTIHEALQKLPINMIVIGLTAAKQGLNPASIIGMLANSYYSKFNGFNKLSDRSEIQLPGQYIKSYDWVDIRLKNEQNVENIETIEVLENDMPEIKRIEAKTNQQKLLDLLNSYKHQAE